MGYLSQFLRYCIRWYCYYSKPGIYRYDPLYAHALFFFLFFFIQEKKSYPSRNDLRYSRHIFLFFLSVNDRRSRANKFHKKAFTNCHFNYRMCIEIVPKAPRTSFSSFSWRRFLYLLWQCRKEDRVASG